MATGPAASPASTGLDLNEDLAALIRVRNRLAQSSDEVLPKVLTGLLPRLLLRLDANSVALTAEIGGEVRATRNQMQTHLLGTLAHALERLRGNKDLSALPWLSAILTFLAAADSPIVRTLTLSFLQIAIPRCTRDMLLSIERDEKSVVASLLQTVDKLYESISFAAQDGTASESIRNDLRTAIWLFFDCIAVLSGIRPLVDWDMDSHGTEEAFYIVPAADNALDPSSETISVAKSIEAVSRDGAGVLDMLLDLFLFSPGLMHSNFEAQTGLSSEGVARMCHRLKSNGAWDQVTENYLKSVKLGCFRYAVSTEHPSLLSGSDVGNSRALLLSVLFASSQSEVGRLAAEYLRFHENRARTERLLSHGAQRGFCSISLACCLLILTIGDEVAESVLTQHPLQQEVWIDVLGKRPLTRSKMRRLPLPSTVSGRVLRYISENVLISSAAPDQDMLRLFLDLLVAVPIRSEYHGLELWSVRLVNEIFRQLDSMFAAGEAQPWLKAFHDRCLVAAMSVLAMVSEPEEDLGRELTGPAGFQPQNANGQMDEETGRRGRRHSQFNQLMKKHRRSLRQKRLRQEDSMKTREAAYELIGKLTPTCRLRSDDPSRSDHVSIDVPLLLFRCAVYEDEMMQPRISHTLGTLLEAYLSVMNTTDTYEKEASLLLPGLVAAACCDSPSARLASAQWTRKLLALMDPVAAYHLSCFLAEDTDAQVAAEAKLAIESFDLRQLHQGQKLSGVEFPFEFIDLATELGRKKITSDLNSEIALVSTQLNIPASAASVLLQEYKFSAKAALDAYQTDKRYVLTKCGIQARCAFRDTCNKDEEHEGHFTCEICYDDELNHAEVYAMPCGHRFCRTCWNSFFQNKLEIDPGLILSATCPDQECGERVTGVDIQYVADGLVPKWKKALLEKFVSQECHHRFCPGADCNIVVVAKNEEAGPFVCERCEGTFCFQCLELPHAPARCADFERWNRIFGSSKFWIKKNTKPCPGCNAPIEKNQGCNHIQCSRCNYEFCWLCLTRLDSHLMAHTCNRYDPVSSAESDDEKRDLFFTERFQAHEEAEFFAKKQLEDCDQRLQKLHGRIWLLDSDDLACLQRTLEKLMQSRKFLKYSYVAAYGKPPGTDRDMFESHQGVLELFTERLTQLCEMSLENVYLEKGESGVHQHMRSIAMYTVSLERYMERILSLTSH